MKVIRKIEEMKKTANTLRGKGDTIGFVPTMGYLHQGHLSLIRMARNECSKVVISIFVNPTQFGPGEDYERYPRDFDRDSRLAEKEGVDYIFCPESTDMYGEDYKTFVEVEKLSKIMCGKYRPGHFKGVCTVVLKLFNIVNPHRAYFGEKDYQQLVIIRRMTRDLNLDVEIKSGPIVRERDGLALSSRNKYLSYDERENATILYECLILAQKMIEGGEKNLEKVKRKVLEKLEGNKFVKKIDYFDFRDPKTLEKKKSVKPLDSILAALAVWIGDTRLIDNKVIKIKR